MSDTPGWQTPIYQSLTHPHLQLGVPRTFFVLDVALMAITGLWTLTAPTLWPVLLIGVALYVVVWCGTKYDTEFFQVVIEHMRHKDRYEG